MELLELDMDGAGATSESEHGTFESSSLRRSVPATTIPQVAKPLPTTRSCARIRGSAIACLTPLYMLVFTPSSYCTVS